MRIELRGLVAHHVGRERFCRFRDFQRGEDLRSRALGFDNQCPVEMAETFAQSAQAHPGAAGLNLGEFFRRNPFTLVTNFDEDARSVARDAYQSGFAVGVAMDVGQTLLHHAEDRQFHLPGKPSNRIGEFEGDHEIAAL